MLCWPRRATPQGCREYGAHRPPRPGRRPRSSRFVGPQPRIASGSGPLPTCRGRGACPRDGDDDPASRSGCPVRRNPGSRFDIVRAGPANRAAPGSGTPRPAATRRRLHQQEPVALGRRCLVVRPDLLRAPHGLWLRDDDVTPGSRPPDPAVWDAGHVPQPGERSLTDASGRRSRPVCVQPGLGSHWRRVPGAGALLHGLLRMEVRPELTALTSRPRPARCHDPQVSARFASGVGANERAPGRFPQCGLLVGSPSHRAASVMRSS